MRTGEMIHLYLMYARVSVKQQRAVKYGQLCIGSIEITQVWNIRRRSYGLIILWENMDTGLLKCSCQFIETEV